jgi:hypothetical protein
MSDAVLTEQRLVQLITSQQVYFANRTPFFTNQDRTTQANDEYSLKVEVIDKSSNSKKCVIHAHLEGPDAITKAHVKSDHFGTTWFNLNRMSTNAAIILGAAFPGPYKVTLQ